MCVYVHGAAFEPLLFQVCGKPEIWGPESTTMQYSNFKQCRAALCICVLGIYLEYACFWSVSVFQIIIVDLYGHE